MANSPNTYSFSSVQATINGPGGNAITIGYSAGPTDEGISVEWKEEKSTMTMGADGTVQHALHAAMPGRMTVRLLKTSPTNALLMQLFNYQRLNPAAWGQNTITVSDVNRGDANALNMAAFAKATGVTYDKTGRFNEWTFDGVLSMFLGTGVASLV